MRRGLERYAPTKGFDVGSLARQKYAALVVRKAGLFPGDWVLDVETGTGILGVQVARAFTRSKVVATDSERVNLEKARANAIAESQGASGRIQFVQCLPDALPFKEEKFFFTTVGLALSREEEPLDVLEEIHRTTGYTGKVYAPSIDFTRAAKKPRGVASWVFDDETMKALREMGFGKLQKMRVTMLVGGGELVLVTMKRFDPEEDDEDESEDDSESEST